MISVIDHSNHVYDRHNHLTLIVKHYLIVVLMTMINIMFYHSCRYLIYELVGNTVGVI
jgi:hypothetical protein